MRYPPAANTASQTMQVRMTSAHARGMSDAAAGRPVPSKGRCSISPSYSAAPPSARRSAPAPADITGAPEGLLLGAAVGLGVWLASRGARPLPLRLSVAAAGLAGGVAGLMIALSGGRLMGGSLDLLARQFPDSRLRLDALGAIAGETGFGPASQVVTAGLEGALFGACVVGVMILVRRRLVAAA